MAGKPLVLLLFSVCLCNLTVQSPQPFYSLQPAVEALSEREAELALRDEMENGNLDDFIDSEDFNFNNDYEERFPLPNRAMGRYMARTGGDYDEFYPSDYRKRSMYRKRDGSVFRERSRGPLIQHQQQQILAEKFLKAIEEERQREEEEEYKKQLRNLWNRYQLEEGDVEKELFNNDLDSEYGLNNDDRKKKRQNGGEVEVAPSYWSDKRSMPLLPWLPASRKKRFPVTKRSPKVNNELIIASPEANEKISQDLQGIFGGDVGKHGDGENALKKKRSSEAHALSVDNSKKDEKSQTENVHVQEAHKKRKRDISDPNDEDEADNDNEKDGKEEEDVDDGDDSDESEEDYKKKRKREAPKNSKGDKKKESESFKWSNIFGLDRKKKSTGLIFHPLEVDKRLRKRYSLADSDCVENDEECDENDYEDEDYRRKKKRSREDKLDIMDRKLKNIENLIIEDTSKYYDYHDGSISPAEARALRNRISERLATAYSLEKMRKAIGKLKESMELEKNLERNLLIGAQAADDDDKKKAKRVAVKKEKAEFDNNHHDIESSEKKVSDEPKKNDLVEDDKKKKKKRSQKKSELNNLISDEAPMSEGYMGGGRLTSDCPVLDNIEKRCRGIDIMSGDSHQNLLDACGEHQLCYLCGDSQLQCDYDYLNDAEEICGHDLRCKIAARQALSVLRNFGGNRISPRECIRSPCLSMALRSVAY